MDRPKRNTKEVLSKDVGFHKKLGISTVQLASGHPVGQIIGFSFIKPFTNVLTISELNRVLQIRNKTGLKLDRNWTNNTSKFVNA